MSQAALNDGAPATTGALGKRLGLLAAERRNLELLLTCHILV